MPKLIWAMVLVGVLVLDGQSAGAMSWIDMALGPTLGPELPVGAFSLAPLFPRQASVGWWPGPRGVVGADDGRLRLIASAQKETPGVQAPVCAPLDKAGAFSGIDPKDPAPPAANEDACKEWHARQWCRAAFGYANYLAAMAYTTYRTNEELHFSHMKLAWQFFNVIKRDCDGKIEQYFYEDTKKMIKVIDLEIDK